MDEKKKEKKLWGKAIDDRKELERIIKFYKRLNKKTPQTERYAIVRELLKSFSITVLFKSLLAAERTIDIHLDASRYFTRIKEADFYKGKPVIYSGRRAGIIEKIYWNGYICVKFEDNQKPIRKRCSPWMVLAMEK